jgi:hypothetical protein
MLALAAQDRDQNLTRIPLILCGIVKNQPQGEALAAGNRAEPVAHLDAVDAARAVDGTLAVGEDDGFAGSWGCVMRRASVRMIGTPPNNDGSVDVGSWRLPRSWRRKVGYTSGI